ncbi:neuronal acetylcholine receptor subunit alpha-3-like isoform X1 [Mercenaria mercenaria]|uniref:neuronal acetylcholine receptor subunit alpha-3-like isoform X1 n=1 Tax=Mercenaria mercenaria TaxID=6596 RepID=UPI00234FB23E|nr:neuronal acetylcholine receptor subunit alpha-3-like isoform X1 [Mercenaria mercenaria]
MYEKTLYFLSTLLVILMGYGQCRFIPSYSKELEMELRRTVFEDYEVWQRPRELNKVRTSMNLLALNYLDIKEQKLSVKAYFHFVWWDPRLSWNTDDNYTNIRFLFSNEQRVWKPAMIVENSVDDIDVLSKPNIPMRIISNGFVAWMPAGIFTTYCESDVTYWPLDTQKCDIILSSWGYTAREVELVFDDDVIVTSFYQENGEWEFIGNTSSSVVIRRELQSFSRLIFTLSFRRRPLFHLLNTLFPVVLMGFLTVAIFKLSPESGERVGLALTILLAYAVYLGLISESIPQTSLTASLLSTYLASILLLQTLAVLLTVIYLDIYFTPEEHPVPRWLQFMTSSCLAKVICKECCCRKSSTTIVLPRKMEAKNSKTDDQTKGDIKEAWTNEEETKVYKRRYSWKEIALMLDKCTMYIYLICVTGFTITCFTLMVRHYNSSYMTM